MQAGEKPREKELAKMFEIAALSHASKPDFYVELQGQLGALLSGETDPIANAANMAALLFNTMPEINWAGFYFLQSETELVLGPFQGKPACVRIAVGQRRVRHGRRASGHDAGRGRQRLSRPYCLRCRFPVRAGRATDP